MSASKLKNLIILILLLANVFLLVQVLPDRLQAREQEDALLERMVQLYETENVTLELESLPETQEACLKTLSADKARDEAMVRALLGENVQIWQKDYQTDFTSELGTATLSDGILAAQMHIPADDPLTFTQSCLAAMGAAESDVTLTQNGSSQICTVRFLPLEGKLLNYTLAFRFRDGALQNVVGFILPADAPLQQKDAMTLTAQQALLEFLGGRASIGWTGSHVYALEQGVAVRAAVGSDDIDLRPSWYITTDAGSYIIDGLTGKISA